MKSVIVFIMSHVTSHCFMSQFLLATFSVSFHLSNHSEPLPNSTNRMLNSTTTTYYNTSVVIEEFSPVQTTALTPNASSTTSSSHLPLTSTATVDYTGFVPSNPIWVQEPTNYYNYQNYYYSTEPSTTSTLPTTTLKGCY